MIAPKVQKKPKQDKVIASNALPAATTAKQDKVIASVASPVATAAKQNKVIAPHASPAAKTAVPKAFASEGRIRERAFQMYEDRGGKHGHDVQDWLRAEHQLVAQ